MLSVLAAEPQTNETTTPPPAAKPTLGARLAGIVDRPTQTLAGVYQQSRGAWVVPLLLVVASLIISMIVSLPYTSQLAREQLRRQLEGLPQEQVAQIQSSMERLTPQLMAVTGVLGSIFSLGVALLVSSGVLYFAGLIIGAELNFVPLLAVMSWCWLPFALRNLVQAGVIFVQRELIVNQGLSWLVSVGDTTKDSANFLYYVLGYAEIFMLWHLFLVGAAAYGAGRVSKGKAAIIALAYAVVNIGLGWIPLVVARLFAPAAGL